tara:strand:+ start:14970 stop:16361 length:1392 start_codon:yes stop_codon:yes gene_type:complete
MSKNGQITNPPTENLVIVGSGPAGYTAAIYASRANLKPILITGFQKGGIPGGQLMTTTFVENFPGFPDGVMGPELMDLMKSQALRWGTQLIEEDAEELQLRRRPFLVKTNETLIKTNSIIIATGASANKLGLKNEDIYWSRGISACAICDGATPQFREEELAVVGGGDSACEEAFYLTKYATKVHLIVRSKELRASKAMADRVLNSQNISIHWNSEVSDLYGSNWLEAIQLKDLISKKEQELKVKGLFYAIGHTPNTDLITNQLNLDSSGYLITEAGRPETSIDGVYAAGDVSDWEWRQGITAAAAGCKAALAAERWLTENNLIQIIPRDKVEPEKVFKSEPIEITDINSFNLNAPYQRGEYALRKLYHESSKPLLVIYTSTNCGPCHVLKPQIRRVLDELNGEAQGVEIDIELSPEIAKQAGINGTPTVQLFKSKNLIKQWKGVKQRSVYVEAIKQNSYKKS